MESLASTLRNAGVNLAAVGDSIPANPEAGEVSAEMTAVLAHFVGSAGELITGVTAAGDQIAAGGGEYADSESVNRNTFQSPN